MEASQNRLHPTLFLVDHEPNLARPQEKLHDYVKREPKYDLAFCRAWSEFEFSKVIPIITASDLLKKIDAIQKSAISHLSYEVQGKATSISYGLGRNWNCDEEGVTALIRDIWINRLDFLNLVVAAPETAPKYAHLQKNSLGITLCDKYSLSSESYDNLSLEDGQVSKKIIATNGSDRNETFERIQKELLLRYRDDKQWKDASYDYSPFGLFSIIDDPAEKKNKILQTLQSYFDQIKDSSSEEEKIKIIVTTLRTLMLLHPYHDGNGRTFYILTNLLLHQNQLKPTHLKNMCLYEGLTVERLVREVIEGQERFEAHFGSLEELSSGLFRYNEAVLQLKQLINNRSLPNSPKHSFLERNFNLLFRQVAASDKQNELLQFLIEKASILNIDLFSKGDKSGNALDVAIKYNNKKAIEQLKQVGLTPSLS